MNHNFQQAGASGEPQNVNKADRNYQKMNGLFSEGKGKKIILGALYDYHKDAPGADDYVSGGAD